MSMSPLLSALMPRTTAKTGTVLDASSADMNPFAGVGTNTQTVRLFTEMNEKLELAGAPFESRLNALTQKEEAVVTNAMGIAKARTSVNKALEGIKVIETSLTEMRSVLATMDGLDPTTYDDYDGTASEEYADDVAYYRAKYDNALARLNKASENYASENNLIGTPRDYTTWAPNTVEYKPNANVMSMATMVGSYLGSDFRIEVDMPDGSKGVWIPTFNDTSKVSSSTVNTIGKSSSGQLTFYGDYNEFNPGKSGEKGDTVGFRDITSFSVDENGTVTMKMLDNDDNEVTVQGKLAQGGVGVGPAFMYDGLSTETAREKAREALSAASAKVFVTKTTMEDYDRSVKKHEEGFKQASADLAKERNKIKGEQEAEQGAIESEYRRMYDVMKMNYDAMQSQQQAYVQIFQSTLNSMGKNNPFFTTNA